ncbi:MAG: DegQ family serine endoprotease [Deltaproteobacteria bacterium]|nr:DegQ family serine endoprotease [Deltaproteobacteria bacterium]MBW2019315.1 DegQ family serine endoprotease [Deltaproteobacteria bacterium]MBW2074363.1 DegQ family serine endoprotease [Deltaproteobacteria bacterium]RLB82295.1 MAG: peptidase [Deltaproteobacteria bacterium]
MNLNKPDKKGAWRLPIVAAVLVSILVGVFLAAGFNITQDTSASHPSSTVMIPANFTDVAMAVSPAIVNIRTEKIIKGGGPVFRHFQSPFGKEDPFFDFFEKFFGDTPRRDFKQRSLGSGFFIDKEGYIVTNNHVIENADKIKVKLKNGKEYDAKIVGRDAKTDIALIKIDSWRDFPAIKMGDSDALKVGEWVVAIGSPFGLENTVTAGIVSAKGRVIGSGPYDDFIQTDASINPGNSGGPLINLKGEVIGINTAIVSRSGGNVGIGFAIPINLARGIIEQLKTSGTVTRGWLGVSIQDLTPELAEYYGVKDGKGALVGETFKGDPADKAGIKPKDVIIEVDGDKIQDSRDLSRKIAEVPVGKKITIKVLRNGKKHTFRVAIAKRTEDKEGLAMKKPMEEADLGMTVSPLTRELAMRFNISEAEGVVVVSVEDGGPADKADVQEGDLILEINHKPIKTLKDYQSQIQEVKKGETVSLLVKRKRGFLALNITK